MIYEMTANLFCAFIGTVGYSVLYNVPKRYYLSCGFTGTMGWLAFLLVKNGTPLSSAVASFFAAVVVVLMSRLLTVRMKCPITIFLVSGIFPLVPGARVYYTVYYLVTSEMGKAAQEGLEALKIAFGIVLGIAVVLAIPREVFQIRYWEQRKYRKYRIKKIQNIRRKER